MIIEENEIILNLADPACRWKEVAMASQQHIKACLVDNKGTWMVKARFTDPAEGKRRLHGKSTGLKVKGNNRRKAEAVMREIVAEWEQLVNSAKSPQNPKLGDRINLWLESKRLSIRENTLASYTDMANKHIIPALGEIRICDLTRQDLLHYFENLKKMGQSVSSMKKHRVIIRGVLKDAISDDLITVNIADSISLKKGARFVGKALSESQVTVVLGKLPQQPEPVRAAVTLALAYGLRRSEICGLRWDNVDFDTQQIHIRNTMTEYRGDYHELEATKTKASRRSICFVPGTDVYLSELLKRQKLSGAFTGKVCAHPDGHFLRPEYVSRSCKRFLESCGIEGIRLHDLRHTAATLLAKHVSAKQVQAFLGHEDIQTTLNIYTHVLDEDSLATSNAMGKYFVGSGCVDICSPTCSPSAQNETSNVIPIHVLESKKFEII